MIINKWIQFILFLKFRQLQKENEELKQLVTEHRSVLEKIMHKYRQHVQQLKLMEEKEKMAVQIFNAGLAQVNKKKKFIRIIHSGI